MLDLAHDTVSVERVKGDKYRARCDVCGANYLRGREVDAVRSAWWHRNAHDVSGVRIGWPNARTGRR